ncbi:MAG TPA: hypothetical protein VFN21_11380 [Acidimicrobiales bacterium]|nr:hypothetical protein [Acidimicrobiales bacterium]
MSDVSPIDDEDPVSLVDGGQSTRHDDGPDAGLDDGSHQLDDVLDDLLGW